MANPNKAKGTSWETEVTNYLNQCDLDARRTGSADADKGDIHAGDWTIEAKAEKVINLPGYLRQVSDAVERRPDGLPWKSAVWVKNRRHGVKDAYAVMSGEDYRALMVYVESLEATLANITHAFVEAGRVRA
jgi:hypothetical protein